MLAALAVLSAEARAAERGIEPPGPLPSMADVPVVEIAAETRPVLARARRHVLEVNQRVRLPEKALPVAVELPADLADGTRLKIEASVSVRDPEAEAAAAAEAHGTAAADRRGGDETKSDERLRLEAPPVVVTVGPHTRAPVLSIPVPEEVAKRRGLLTVLAWELPAEAVVTREVGPWAVSRGDRLEFGFGVEPEGWEKGYPPVRFRVFGVPDGGGDEVLLFERALDPVRDARDRRWFDASVGLEPVWGKSVRLRFEGEAITSAPDVEVPRTFPVFSDPRLLRAEDTANRRRNLILISIDTLGAAHVGAYGYRHPTTPSLDRRLAAAGALVRHAIVAVPFTPPSHMTMLTGLEPCAHQVLDRDGILAPEDLLLAEILRNAGYDTAAFTEDAFVVAGAGFARGFDTYVEQRAAAESAPGFAAETLGAAEQWLLRRAHQPFFLFIHTYQVHQPYTPPRGLAGLFGDFPPSDHREQRWKDDQQAYDQEVRHTDELLASFLDVLDAKGLTDDTVVVLTADHGEEFGAHKWGGHGFGLWDEAVEVPLLIRAPGLIEPGTRVEPQVGMVDLMPTLLDLLDVPLPRPVQGQSFAPLLTHRGPGHFEERPIVSRATGFDIVGVRTPEAKYIRTTAAKKTTEELFWLPSDPKETHSVAAQHPGAMARARAALAAYEKSCADYRREHPVTAGKDQLFEHRPDWLINRNEIERKLRSLGYVE